MTITAEAPQSALSNEFLYSVFHLAPIGIVIADSQGVITDANQYICAVTDYEKAELVGQKVEILLPERFRGGHIKLREDFVSHPSNRMMGRNRELHAVSKLGNEFPIEVGLAPVQAESGLRIIVTITDVTLKRESDKKLRALSSELEEVSTPILEVWENVAVVPIIGTLDTERAQKLMENTLIKMKEARFKVTILDITGLSGIDTSVAHHLLRLTSAIRLMGGYSVLTGISPEIAKTIVRLGVNLGELKTSSTLSRGLRHAIEILDKN